MLVLFKFADNCLKFASANSVQTQTDMITNVTIERFTNILNGEKAAEFSRIIDIILSGYGCMEIDSNTLFVEIYHGEEIQVLKIAFFSSLVFPKKNATTPSGGVSEERNDEQRRVSYCPLNQMAMP